MYYTNYSSPKDLCIIPTFPKDLYMYYANYSFPKYLCIIPTFPKNLYIIPTYIVLLNIYVLSHLVFRNI